MTNSEFMRKVERVKATRKAVIEFHLADGASKDTATSKGEVAAFAVIAGTMPSQAIVDSCRQP